MATEEEWRAVVGWEDRYEVSNLGRVRSLDHTDQRGQVHPGRVLAVFVQPSGHVRVSLGSGSRRRRLRVHRLVAEAFLGPAPEGKPLVLHWDDDPGNNAVGNLRWGDHRDNNLDCTRNGHNYFANRTHCPHGHPYSPGNTYVNPTSGGRFCRTCYREATRRRRAA